jgi:hypothetical protein
MSLPNTEENFYSRIVESSNGCYEWSGYCKKTGYGWVMFNGRNWLAHRLVWTLKNGPIPVGICVCHKCDNPKCCNVDHLFLGTVLENIEDMIKKGRGQHKHSFEMVKAIRSFSNSGLPKKEVAKMFSVSRSYVSSIWLGRKRSVS